MKSTLEFSPDSHQLTGPAGSLDIAPDDVLARRFLMLVEGQCLQQNATATAAKFGYSRPRYYQLLAAYEQGGLGALRPQKSGPKSNYRRTEQVVRLVLRHRFLDPEASAEVLTQKLQQSHWPVSLRSVHRIIADYGLQKKTLRPQSRQPSAPSGRPKHPGAPAPGRRRPAQRGTGGATTPGR